MNSEPLKILWEDDDVIVPEKLPLLNSEHTEDQKGLPDLLTGPHGDYIAPIHRLDFGVGGLLLCAKNQKAAAFLSRALLEGKIKKEYLALVHGKTPDSGRLEDLLFYDRKAGKSFVTDRVRKGVKEARLSYERLGTLITPAGELSLVRIFPETGRTHQIRVQFSHAGYPLLGDRKYGSKVSHPIGLFCTRLTFPHPAAKKMISVESLPRGDVWDLFLQNQ